MMKQQNWDTNPDLWCFHHSREGLGGPSLKPETGRGPALVGARWRGRVLSQHPGGQGGACTLWVESPGHQTLQLHSGGVVLGCIGGVGGDSSPASESGLGGLRHPQPHRFLGGERETRQEREASYFCDKDSKVEKQTYLSVRALEQLILSFA